MNIYYVYAYVRSKDSQTAKAGTPYYIGKGKGKRAIQNHPGISVPSDKTKIILIEQRLTNVGACAIERRLIRWYGRKDLGTGILLNRTSGGEGGKGGSKKSRIVSEKRRKQISEAGKGRIHSEESKRKISLSKIGKKRGEFSTTWRENLSKGARDRDRSKMKPFPEELKKHYSKIYSIPVYCITNDTWYDSKKVAAVELGLKAGNIGHCLLGHQKTTGNGFMFSYKKCDGQSFQP